MGACVEGQVDFDVAGFWDDERTEGQAVRSYRGHERGGHLSSHTDQGVGDHASVITWLLRVSLYASRSTYSGFLRIFLAYRGRDHRPACTHAVCGRARRGGNDETVSLYRGDLEAVD